MATTLRTSMEKTFLIGLVAGVTIAFLWMVGSLATPIFWAVVLAVLFESAYRWLHRRLGGREALAAGATILLILVVVVLPLSAIGAAVTSEAAALYQRIESGAINVQAPIDAAERAMPQVARVMERFGLDVDRLRQSLSGVAVTVSRFLASQALAIGQNALRMLLMIVVTLYLLFFFLRDGDRLTAAIVRALPLGDVRERQLMERFARITRATMKGTIIVAMAQGALGGVTFALLGIPAAVFWGVVMTVISLLPAVGSGIVWVPAAIILALTGQVAKGVILVLVGALVIGMVDNVLRPILVGRETRIPDWIVFISILGGLASVGLSGFVIGPVVAGLFLTVWEMFTEEYGPVDNIPASGATPPVEVAVTVLNVEAPPEPPPTPS
ncbi:MAG: AI-2E family transporter [Gemmatimonadales bacterium]|nr:AI-2E family transporter [Gemmatimonadales bacterium]